MRRVGTDARGTGGFTIVEVLVALLLTTMVLAGATALATGSSRVQSTAKLRQRQVAAGEALMKRVKSEPAWGRKLTCKESHKTGTPCKLHLIMPSLASDDSLQVDAKTQLGFTVQAYALGVDSTTDRTGGNDVDGLVPDYYRTTVIIRPDAATKARFPKLQPYILTANTNPAARVDEGSLVIQACGINPQRDDRIPIATCPQNVKQPQELVPPVDVENKGRNGCNSTSDGKDCASYRCAAKDMPGCFSNSWTASKQPNYTRLNIQAYSGWTYLIKGASNDSNTKGYIKSGPLGADGLVVLKGLTPGQYIVTITPTPGWVLWTTHSVPFGGFATVEAGLESRVIQMFRPADRPGYFRVSLQTTDVTRPWAPVEYNYLYKTSASGCLMPSPIGRAPLGSCDSKGPGATFLHFTGVEPGLYMAYLVNSAKNSYKALTNHPGFLWIPRTGATIPPSDPYGSRAFYMTYWCDEQIRLSLKTWNSESNQYVFAGSPDTGGNRFWETHYTYDSNGNVTGSYQHYHDDPDGQPDYPWSSCGSGGGGGGSPPPGGGGTPGA